MNNSENKPKFNIWLGILLVAAIIVALVSIIGRNSDSKALNDANDKLSQLQQEYDMKKEELLKQAEEKLTELENVKTEAKAEVDKVTKEKDEVIEGLKKGKEESEKKLNGEKEALVSKVKELEKSIGEKLSKEELDKKVAEATEELKSQVEVYAVNSKKLQDFLTGFIVKYSNDENTTAKDAIKELSTTLQELFNK